ncbi:ATP-binding protein [Candidatus Parabeggiatoa sp. HSG14]|uniref:ATP-binding protein n=1 Tax=Candidatus Parabeggiatoa sp. HSG14 TaxID=3055593 RepID=UPI0025A721D7|nr:ATP-binding protein [Thiotrichales bacterium HSG14]
MLPKLFKSQNSLTRTTIIKMGIRIAIIIIAVTLVSYWHVMSNLELQVVEQLDKYITERGQHESTLFLLAEDNHAELKKELLWQLKKLGDQNPQAEFNRLFVRYPDGVIRNRPELFDGTRQAGVYIDETLTINADIRRRVLTFYELSTLYGKAWHNRFQDTYIFSPENIEAVYWPEFPTWTQEATTDLYMPDEEWGRIADKKHNPKREIAWTGLFYETVSKMWMVSCITPVDIADRHIATIGHDIVLNELFDRTTTDHIEGTHNLIFREDGRLIAHPQYMGQIMEASTELDILKLDNQYLLNIFQSVTNRHADTVVIENHQNDEYLAITKIEGPDWYLVTVYPKSLMANLALNTASFILFLGLLSLLIEITVLFFVLRRQIAQPLQEFIGATQKIASRNFSLEATQHLPLSREDEIGELAHSFNSMAGQLKTSFDTLDAKVIERTAQLNDKIDELTRTRQELVHSEKMAALGQLVAGIAHEVNTPLGAIHSSAETLTNSLKQTLAQFPKLFEILTKTQQDIFFALLEHSLQNRVILTIKEKRAAKKTLTTELKQCGIANPRTFTDTFISLGIYAQLDQYLPLLQNANSDFVFEIAYKLSTLTRSTENIIAAVERAAKVVFALKTFARHDKSGEKTTAHLQEGLETVFTLYHSQIKQGIKLIKEYADLPPILCYPDELNQVWTNILHNALQAMDYKGSLKVTISQQDNYAVVAITDSGQGMSPEIQEKIFTPFFTTKSAGEGSGLGLDIVQKIVEKHEGKIEVDSEIGKGTTFSVLLPI